jgi:hypothetical protein
MRVGTVVFHLFWLETASVRVQKVQVLRAGNHRTNRQGYQNSGRYSKDKADAEEAEAADKETRKAPKETIDKVTVNLDLMDLTA